MTDVQHAIIRELYAALEKLGAPYKLLAAVGSWGDTADDAGRATSSSIRRRGCRERGRSIRGHVLRACRLKLSSTQARTISLRGRPRACLGLPWDFKSPP